MSPSKISFDDLWRFYCDSGFVYQAKEHKLQPYMPAIATTWTKLLEADDSVFKLVSHAKNGHIRSALAITRYYQSSWMIHHMASLTDPWGMKLVLAQAIKWMMANQELDNGIFYWRPNNSRADVRFSNLGKLLEKSGAEVSTQKLYDYYYFATDEPVNAQGPRIARIRRAPAEEHGRIADLLAQVVDPHEIALRGLTRQDLGLDRLDRLYRPHGLSRTREVFTVRAGGSIEAVALLENGSAGLNFSHFFNKFHLYFIKQDTSFSRRAAICREVLGFLTARCRDQGQGFLVCLCESQLSELLRSLGHHSHKQYACMSISRRLENSLTLQHFNNFYGRRMSAMR